MWHIALIQLTDQGSGQNGFVVIRAGERQVALGLSLEEDGDIEIVMDREIAEQVEAALRQAIQVLIEQE